MAGTSPAMTAELISSGQSPFAFRKSITAPSNAAGSSMQQAWPVPGSTTCCAPGIIDAVSPPRTSDTSCAPLITIVGGFIPAKRSRMSQASRARKICAMHSPLSSMPEQP